MVKTEAERRRKENGKEKGKRRELLKEQDSSPSQIRNQSSTDQVERHSASQQQRPPVWVVPPAFLPAPQPLPSLQTPSAQVPQLRFVPRTTPSPSILQMCRQPMIERMDPIQRERVDQLNKLYTPSPTYIFVLVARWLLQELDEISNAIRRGSALRDLVNNLRKITRKIDSAARVYMMQRQGLINRNVPGRPSADADSIIFRYLNNLIEICQMIGNMNELILMDDPTVTAAEALRAITAISSILRDSLTQLAPEVEGSEEIVERMRKMYLDQQHHQSNPQSAPGLASPTPQVRSDASSNAKTKASSSKQQCQ